MRGNLAGRKIAKCLDEEDNKVGFLLDNSINSKYHHADGDEKRCFCTKVRVCWSPVNTIRPSEAGCRYRVINHNCYGCYRFPSSSKTDAILKVVERVAPWAWAGGKTTDNA